ncbi:MAG: aspartate--tRNA(Asn) ligase [Candidatus Kaiserbacteria bacterium]|nr:aspartate--tRNA(Asn) ligase [Candidatus Kaiserbacteria bacterium]
MERCLLRQVREHNGSEVTVWGKVLVVRDHGKVLFIDLADRTGSVQCVLKGDHPQFAEAQKLTPESILMVTGAVQDRSEKNRSDGDNGALEILVSSFSQSAAAQTLPFDRDADINIDTLFDYRPLTLRRSREQAVFRVQMSVAQAFREYLSGEGFMEFQAPAIVGGDAEGGAEVFGVDYFDKRASLATSPQLYKQILVGAFERVFSVGNVFRAEKHSTSRHLNEYTSMDFEMGYITDHTDVQAMLEGCVRHIVRQVADRCKNHLTVLEASLPIVPETPFPSMKLTEAQVLLSEKYGISCEGEKDLAPEHERVLCEHAQKETGSDFIFITHYPTETRPMYTYDDADDPGYTKGFDLLFRGIEISTGGQRIHDYSTLIEKITKKTGIADPETVFSFYLQAFRYGMPPHGGMGMGLERLTAKLCGLQNAKEASMFPRDRNRIDVKLYDE